VPTPPPMAETSLAELRADLLRRGMSKKGLKSELRQRLEYELLHDRLQFNSWDPVSLSWHETGAAPPAAATGAAPAPAIQPESAAPPQPPSERSPPSSLPDLVPTETPQVSEEMKLRELRQRLIDRGLSVSGLKSELRTRLSFELLQDRQQFQTWDPITGKWLSPGEPTADTPAAQDAPDLVPTPAPIADASTLRELRADLVNRGFAVTGLKSELRQRLEYELLHDRQQFNSWDPVSLAWLRP